MSLPYDPDVAINVLTQADPPLARLIEQVGPFELELRSVDSSPFDALMRAIRPVDVLRRVDELLAERAGSTSPQMPQTAASESEAGRVKEAAL
ncbi:MAG: hypothetical protein IH820_02925 [Bacteroidetes bacterium]|nr:hypothetical protein [Bacteroidota bacterium]